MNRKYEHRIFNAYFIKYISLIQWNLWCKFSKRKVMARSPLWLPFHLIELFTYSENQYVYLEQSKLKINWIIPNALLMCFDCDVHMDVFTMWIGIDLNVRIQEIVSAFHEKVGIMYCVILMGLFIIDLWRVSNINISFQTRLTYYGTSTSVLLSFSVVTWQDIRVFFSINTKLPIMALLALKVFTTAKLTSTYLYNLQWGLTWWSLDQESNAYPTELAWHVLVSLRLLYPYIVIIYWFQVNQLSPKSEVVHEQMSV